MYTRNDIDSAREIVLAELPEVKAIYLFGSYAKGTAGVNSDLDIAIILS
ncbi:MAG TPA: nucleotidyltransferase domain-containing protein, partial [Spirochaetota bacterium]